MSICLDGSGFDSTQLAILLKLVDNLLFTILLPFFRKALQSSQSLYPNLFRADVEDVLQGVYSAATDLNNVCFTKIPDVKHR